MGEQPFRLRCPKCLASMQADRDDMDPADATVMEIICPNCDDGDRHSPRYFRCDGTELLFGRDFDTALARSADREVG